jgi:CheY-like chemotaxis protein
MYSILYVDDEEGLPEIGKLFLESDGTMTVETLTSARAALERIGSAPYDAVISDYEMPVMDGIEFLKAVRSRFGDLPFILFTARARRRWLSRLSIMAWTSTSRKAGTRVPSLPSWPTR